MSVLNATEFIYKDKNTRVWLAQHSDYKFILHLCKQFRDHEFFYVTDSALKDEIRKRNIIAFDYNVFEAGYIWVTFPRNGRSRINQLAVDKDLWRNHVGTIVVKVYEDLADRFGCWSSYLSCNTNTPGDNFWPTVNYSRVCKKPAGGRGGENIIWGKLLPRNSDLLMPFNVDQIKGIDTYVNQSSITQSIKNKKEILENNSQGELDL